jgi:hypothetical protein
VKRLICQKKNPKAEQGGFFYMGSSPKTDKKLTNGAILIFSKVLKHVMSSAVEAEIGAVFINAKEGAVLRTTLEELGHPLLEWGFHSVISILLFSD